jgi:predicted RNA-binding protein with PUA-like domain
MWLLKTEPSEYSYDDLARQGRTAWDGVRNPVALKNLRQMKVGDRAFVYHTGGEKAVVGLAEVVRSAYVSGGGLVVDVAAAGRLDTPVSLAEMKGLAAFADSPLVRQGRLSVVPLTAAQWKAVESRGRR